MEMKRQQRRLSHYRAVAGKVCHRLTAQQHTRAKKNARQRDDGHSRQGEQQLSDFTENQ